MSTAHHALHETVKALVPQHRKGYIDILLLQRKKPETVFLGGKGAFETCRPLFCPRLFSTVRKRGRAICSVNLQKMGLRHKPPQTDTNRHKRHKPAQTGTIFCAGAINFEGGSSLAPFSLFVTPVNHIPAQSRTGGEPRHVHWMVTRGAGRVWQQGAAEGQMRSTLHCRRQIHHRHHCCGPILLPLLHLLSATALPPLAPIIIILFIFGSSGDGVLAEGPPHCRPHIHCAAPFSCH